MVLFFLSLLLTIITGFFVTSIFEQKNFIKIFIYFCLTMFASIVANVELLSVFSKITANNILLINLIFSIITGYFWIKKGKPLFKIRFKRFFKKLFYSIMSDKYLLILGTAFLCMCGVSLFLIAIMPVVNPDAEAYHVLRSLFWISNGNLNHFTIADYRNLPMPINSEILYLWILIFLKKQLWLGIFSFTSFLLAIISLYGIIGKIGFSERHKLWVIFILSSFPSVIVQISGTETDVIIAGLVLASIYLYWSSLKTGKKSELYFAALAYSLAIGTKTPSLMLMFPIGLWMLWMGYHYFQKDFYKPFLKFIGFGIINFIFFASYNYILNYVDYGNIFGPVYFIQTHKNLYGVKGAIASFIKHIFLFFDFTGFRWDETVGHHILNLKANILNALHLNYVSDGIYTRIEERLNHLLLEPVMGMGILGFLIYLPCWIYSMIKSLFNRTKATSIICSFGLILLGAIIVMSYEIAHMTFNIRFLTAFCIVAAPILIYSYSRKNNIPKFIITLFALFGLLFISRYLMARPFSKIYTHLKQGTSIHEIRDIAKCSDLRIPTSYKTKVTLNVMCKVEKQIRTFDKGSKILYFPNSSENLLIIKLLEFEGYDITYALLKDADKINFEDYDVIIIRGNEQFLDNTDNNNQARVINPRPGITCHDLPIPPTTPLPNREKILYMTDCKISKQFFTDNNFAEIKAIPYKVYDEFDFDYIFYAKQK